MKPSPNNFKPSRAPTTTTTAGGSQSKANSNYNSEEEFYSNFEEIITSDSSDDEDAPTLPTRTNKTNDDDDDRRSRGFPKIPAPLEAKYDPFILSMPAEVPPTTATPNIQKPQKRDAQAKSVTPSTKAHGTSRLAAQLNKTPVAKSPTSIPPTPLYASPNTIGGPSLNLRVPSATSQNPNLIPLGNKTGELPSTSSSPETEPREEDMDEVDRLCHEWEKELVISAQVLEDEGNVYFDKVHAVITFMGPFTAHNNEKVQAFFYLLSPVWYRKATYALVGKVVHVVFHDEEDIEEGIKWLKGCNPNIATFFANNTKVEAVVRESYEYLGYGLPRGENAEAYFDILINQALMPREGLVKITFFYSVENQVSTTTGGFLLEYTHPPVKFSKLSMTRDRTYIKIPHRRLSISEYTHGPWWLRHKCRNCSQSHPKCRCSFRIEERDGKQVKVINPQALRTPRDEIKIEFSEQTKQRAVGRNEIVPPLDKEWIDAIDEQVRAHRGNPLNPQAAVLSRNLEKRLKELKKKKKGGKSKGQNGEDEMRTVPFPSTPSSKVTISHPNSSKKGSKLKRGKKKEAEEEFDAMVIDSPPETPQKKTPTDKTSKLKETIQKSPHNESPPALLATSTPKPVTRSDRDDLSIDRGSTVENPKPTRSNQKIRLNMFELQDPERRKRSRSITSEVNDNAKEAKLLSNPPPPTKKYKQTDDCKEDIVVTKHIIADSSIKEVPPSPPKRTASDGWVTITCEDSPVYIPLSPDWNYHNSPEDLNIKRPNKASGVSTPDAEI
jgi:hypothetical protein